MYHYRTERVALYGLMTVSETYGDGTYVLNIADSMLRAGILTHRYLNYFDFGRHN